MTRKQIHLLEMTIQFLKLQLAGSIIFLGTYLGYFLSDFVFNKPTLTALAISSLIAHGVFFMVSREWVFDKKTGQKRTHQQIIRFALFMGLNFGLNLLIIEVLRRYFGLSPYIGQLITGPLLALWGYFGLKFWVFQDKPVNALKRRATAK